MTNGKISYSSLSYEDKLAYMREANRRSYLKRVGGELSRQSPLNSDPEVTKQKKRESVSQWQKNNPEKVAQIRLKQKLNGNDKAKTARRRSRKKQACPDWSDQQVIKLIYECCPVGYHVDHIIPLTNNLVCGLHVPSNLQYLPAIENIKKGNKLCPL